MEDSSKLTFTSILEAKRRILPYLKPTPLTRTEALEKELGFPGQIYFKLDSDMPTGSFKVRGAFNNLLQLTVEEKKKGIITRSSGNFAQAVAYAANSLGVLATIVMPNNAPKIKVEGTKQWGAQIEYSSSKHEEGEAVVEKLVEEKGYIPLHPYNNYRTMAGQGTGALEILQECPSIDHFFCPIGGGGLLSGCSLAFKESKPTIQTYGVEPAGAGDYHASRQTGQKQVWENVNTIADGLRASTVGDLNYPILNQYVDQTEIVTEDEIKAAMALFYRLFNSPIEPSGAVSLAGFLKRFKELQGNVVIFISGQNVDPASFKEWTKSP